MLQQCFRQINKYRLIWTLLELLLFAEGYNGAVVPPPWADPQLNPCAKQPSGWQLLFWPPDGGCYKIFQVGPPCPEGMELIPASSKEGKELYAECRCPPEYALSNTDGKCYKLFTIGPCLPGSFFGPETVYKNNVTTSKQEIGTCKTIPKCPTTNSIYWLRNQKCYQKLTRGPCPKGQLLTMDSNKIPACACNKQKEIEIYRARDGKCYQHFTRGPCKEMGHLFLPDKTCGCHSFLPHYYHRTGKCYELGTIGPCDKGEMFSILPKTSNGGCVCRTGNIRYKNHTSCHRPYTQGPCQRNEFLIDSNTCTRQPCSRGELYYPEDGECYKVGSRGPCPRGKIVSFDFETRPSIDGISFNGVCVCRRKDCADDEKTDCDRGKGFVRYGDKCFKMYIQGPCSKGEWIAPSREGRELLSSDTIDGVCECVPGNVVRRVRNSENEVYTECLPQTAVLVEFLNRTFTKAQLDKLQM